MWLPHVARTCGPGLWMEDVKSGPHVSHHLGYFPGRSVRPWRLYRLWLVVMPLVGVVVVVVVVVVVRRSRYRSVVCESLRWPAVPL